mgnify:CR=1 FL=1
MIWMVGESINFDNARALRVSGEREIDSEAMPQFDFSSVKQCDSSALSLLLVWRRFASKKAKIVIFISVPASLVGLATVCNVASILGIEEQHG